VVAVDAGTQITDLLVNDHGCLMPCATPPGVSLVTVHDG
jgi:hypothetical protein